MISQTKYRKQMLDTFLAAVPLLMMAFFYYGPRPLVMAGISIGAAVLTDYICLLLHGERIWQQHDYSAVITGLLFVLFLPASAPYWLVVTGSVFAMAVIRHPFGGHYNTLFNPAVTAYAFLIICWNTLTTQYPLPMQKLPLEPTVKTALYTSPAYRLMLGGAESISLLDSLLGNFVGPMGATCILVLACCGVYLAVRKTIFWQIPAAAFSIVAIFAYVMPRVNSSRGSSVKLELISGVLIYSVLFIAAMDNGEIKTNLGKWVYGVMLGLLVVLFRNLSKIELVSPFAIIIMNAVDHKCDDYGQNILRLIKNIFLGVWKLLKWILQKTGRLFVYLWDAFFKLIQKIIDK